MTDPGDVPTGQAQLCFSLAERPGTFGSTVHNAAFRALGLDYFYKPLAVTRDGLAPTIEALRRIGAHGWALSMPFKVTVLPLLDHVEPEAARLEAVNTVLNRNGRLEGWNTDLAGASFVLDHLAPDPAAEALVLGAGGAARAVVAALREHGFTAIALCCRRPNQAEWAARAGCRVLPWDERARHPAGLLINATPIGMAATDPLALDSEALSGFSWVFDAVASAPETALIRAARAGGSRAAPGTWMALAQAAEQFRIYTGHPAPLEVMAQAAGLALPA